MRERSLQHGGLGYTRILLGVSRVLVPGAPSGTESLHFAEAALSGESSFGKILVTPR
jgi:hypothetical protein